MESFIAKAAVLFFAGVTAISTSFGTDSKPKIVAGVATGGALEFVKRRVLFWAK